MVKSTGRDRRRARRLVAEQRVRGVVGRLRLRRKKAEEEEGEESGFAFLKDLPRIFPYLRPYKKLAGGSIGLMVVGILASLAAPWPLAIVIDTILGDKPLPSILGGLDGVSTTGILIIAVVGGLLLTGVEHGTAIVDDYVNTKLDQSMVLDLRSDLFRHAQRLSLAFHDRRKTGGLMYQINNQASAVGTVTVSLPPLFQALFTVIGMFLIAYAIEPLLALLSLSVVPFIYMSAGYYAKKIHPQLIHVRNLEGQSLSIVHEAMSMLRVIVAFGREGHEYKKFRSQAETAVDARVKLTVRQTAFSLAVNMITAVGSALVLGFGAWGVLHGRLSAGELVVVIGYVAEIYRPLEQISATFAQLQQSMISLTGALDLLETDLDVKEAPDAIDIGRSRGDVAFEHVSFSYVGRKDTLKDIHFDVESGARVAIVGPTGAGKTTLLSLMTRFMDPQEGRVMLDGIDVRQLKLDSLRAQTSIVLQEPLLFSATIAENIAYGDLGASRERIESAARAANAHDFITALPKGYETELGERGAQLSGGERQRVAVARAFLKDAPILILDEPTSSIDSKTEGVILQALERLMVGRTTFMIAHRLSTVRNADLILVVDHGELVEKGSHEELLASDGLYKEMHDAQGAPPPKAGPARPAGGWDVDAHRPVDETAQARLEAAQRMRSGPLPELARMIQAPSADDPERSSGGEEAPWLLVGATRSMMEHGAPDALLALAARVDDPNEEIRIVARVAESLLQDLGLVPEPQDRHDLVGGASS